MTNGGKNIIAIAVVAALAAGGAFLYSRYDDHMTAVSAASLDWPSVEGLVTHSNLESHRRTTGTNKKIRWDVEIYYEYVVDDAVFSNDVVRFDQNNLPKSDKERLVSAYPKGRQVEVFYNPDKPGQSVLVRGSWR